MVVILYKFKASQDQCKVLTIKNINTF
jgi:hypothetical protein